MSNIKNRLEYILKHNLMIQKIYKVTMSLFFQFIGLFIKVDLKMILFNSLGKKYNDSPKAIFEYMLKDDKYRDFKFVWALDKPEEYDIPNCKKIRMDTIEYFIIALRSKYWVTCVNIERSLHFKKKQTKYLNTWHGIPLKLIGNAVGARNDFDFSDIDIFCYSSNYEKEIYKRDFNVKEKNLLLSGLPRNDELYNVSSDLIKYYKKLLDLPIDKKVILYAPTWRESLNKGEDYSIKPPIDFEYWESKLGDEYILLLRTHVITNEILGVEFNQFVRNYSSYPDINHLLIASDILISDYSATIFDYSILERPIFCFGYDYEEYKNSRGLYLDLDKELPNGVIKTQEELVSKIINSNYQKESEKTKLFKEKYLEFGGNSTEQCIDILFK